MIHARRRRPPVAAVSTRAVNIQEQVNSATWLARAAAGDGAALASLYDYHARTVYSLAFRIVGNEADAEDVVQEVFAQVWRQSGRYDHTRGTVEAWLLMMTRTRAIDRLRARVARPDSAAVADSASDEPRALVVDPADALTAADDAKRIREALHELPILQRLAIELAYFEGLTQSQIADRLEEPLGTVKTRIRRGLLKLRDALSRSTAGGAA
jgi:RNA polymerase sigma-70 factor, ECF subfamily